MIKVREKFAKTILSKSKVYDYTVNPYTGCEHSCTYCYARFMKITSKEEWGSFVEVKCNVPQLLQKEKKYEKKLLLINQLVFQPPGGDMLLC